MKTGIYAIVNKINGHIYIGSAVNIRNRWATHLNSLRLDRHHSGYLQNAWNKYGEDNFEFIVVEECVRDILIEREQFYIDNLKPEYNICPLARCSKGVLISEETRRKLREARARRVTKPETREKLSRAGKGRKHTPEHCAKIAAAQIGNKRGLGRVVSQETRDKCSATQKAKYLQRLAELEAQVVAG